MAFTNTFVEDDEAVLGTGFLVVYKRIDGEGAPEADAEFAFNVDGNPCRVRAAVVGPPRRL